MAVYRVVVRRGVQHRFRRPRQHPDSAQGDRRIHRQRRMRADQPSRPEPKRGGGGSPRDAASSQAASSRGVNGLSACFIPKRSKNAVLVLCRVTSPTNAIARIICEGLLCDCLRLAWSTPTASFRISTRARVRVPGPTSVEAFCFVVHGPHQTRAQRRIATLVLCAALVPERSACTNIALLK